MSQSLLKQTITTKDNIKVGSYLVQSVQSSCPELFFIYKITDIMTSKLYLCILFAKIVNNNIEISNFETNSYPYAIGNGSLNHQ